MDDIKSIVKKVIQDISEKNIHEQEHIQRVWERILREEGFKDTRIAGLKDNKLTICVDSSARLYEMKLHQKEILMKIKQEIPEIGKVT